MATLASSASQEQTCVTSILLAMFPFMPCTPSLAFALDTLLQRPDDNILKHQSEKRNSSKRPSKCSAFLTQHAVQQMPLKHNTMSTCRWLHVYAEKSSFSVKPVWIVLFIPVKSWSSRPTIRPHHLSIEVTPKQPLSCCLCFLVVLCCEM